MQYRKSLAWMKKNLFSIVTIALSFGILGAFLTTGDGMRNFRYAGERFLKVWLVWIAAGVAAGWLLESLVLHLLCRHIDRGWTFGRSFYVGMVGLFYSALTPFCMGEPMEIYNMSKMGMDAGTASSVIGVKSLVHHAVMLAYSLFLISLRLRYFQTRVSNFSFLTLFGLLTNAVFIAMVLLFILKESAADGVLKAIVRLMDRMGMRRVSHRFYGSVHGQLEAFHDCSRRIGKAGMLYVWASLLTLLQITVASLISYFVYRSFGLRGESVLTMVAADTFVTMVATFIPLPGSSGGMEGGFYLFFQEFFGQAIVPGITLWRLSTYYVNIFFGFFIVAAGKRKYRLNQAEDLRGRTADCAAKP